MSSPGPPPPPAPGPPPPPGPPAFKPGKSKSSGDDRGALLQSIRQGAKLKKAVTNDKSGPYIPGKPSSTNDPQPDSTARSPARPPNPAAANGGMALGGLFAGGMPKLRPTGISIGTCTCFLEPSLRQPPPLLLLLRVIFTMQTVTKKSNNHHETAEKFHHISFTKNIL